MCVHFDQVATHFENILVKENAHNEQLSLLPHYFQPYSIIILSFIGIESLQCFQNLQQQLDLL